jgi:arginine utilization protein RocB
MVRVASVTESDGERLFPETLRTIIARELYFQLNPAHVWLEPIEHDPFLRSNIMALVRGEGSKTVVLTGHFDVVSSANYGPLEPWAFEPEMLTDKLIEDLRVNARSAAEFRALHDLESGEFLPGRGLLDMKSGLAAGLDALYRFSELEQRVGNLLFLGVSDEEVQSHGARGAMRQLERICAEHGLEVTAIINLDATSDDGDGSNGQALYLGSVGKLLVSTYVIGGDTHAGYPFSGINPNFLASQIACRLECNPALADHAHGEAAPPPTSLKQSDLKTHYDVTTPGRAWALYNVLTHGKPAQRVLEDFCREVQIALDQSLDVLRTRAKTWGFEQAEALNVQAFTMTYKTLCERVRDRIGPDFDVRLTTFVESLEPKLDAPTKAARITDFVWSLSELIGPAAILGFGSLHYPAVLLNQEHSPQDSRVIKTIRGAIQTAQRDLGITIRERKFFAGISDMSWFGHADESDLEFVSGNTPEPGARIRGVPLGKPIINLGPWGRDYHQWLERAHCRYTFEQLPELVWRVSRALLEPTSDSQFIHDTNAADSLA